MLTESTWDGGIVTEGVKPETGMPDKDGRGFATAAGYVAHVICEQFCTDRKPGEMETRNMHRSRINGLLIDCNADDIDLAARFWAEALGRAVDPDHPGTRGDYRMLEDAAGRAQRADPARRP